MLDKPEPFAYQRRATAHPGVEPRMCRCSCPLVEGGQGREAGTPGLDPGMPLNSCPPAAEGAGRPGRCGPGHAVVPVPLWRGVRYSDHFWSEAPSERPSAGASCFWYKTRLESRVIRAVRGIYVPLDSNII
jgi:hypothetical protein